VRRFPLPLFLLILLLTGAAVGQSPNGTISGLLLDPSGRAITGADVLIVNDATGIRYPGATNGEGIYAVSNLPPGSYRIQVSKVGFKTLIKPDVVLNVQDAMAINFTLPVGAIAEIVTVQGGAPLVNAESGSVSTVIDRKFVENLPLNGRSFNTLLQLTPGVVIAQSGQGNQGQFSVSGQRTTANNFLIDGASANFGAAPTLGQGTSGTGAAQAFSVLGGTSSLVSVEALQEFRVETSSFTPEFGRSPGGQVLLTTRSGTNDLHGGIYEYFRNDVLDANDWFANQRGKPRAPERHNDFGGFLGGPIKTDKTFFFLSYEGARLRQPNTKVVQVPSEYARTVASSSVSPFLNGYPRPDDRTGTPGVYTGQFTGNFSNPSTLDAGSVRIDHHFGSGFSIFARYNEAPSETMQRSQSLSEVDTSNVRTRTATVSAIMAPILTVSNTFRANYSAQNARFISSLDSFGGAVPPNPNVLAPGLANGEDALLGFFSFDTGIYLTGPDARNRSTQLNFADDLIFTRGTHQLKFGVDYRAIYLDVRPFQSSLTYEASSVSDLVSTDTVLLLVGSTAKPSYFLSRSASIYGQDIWKATPRLTLTYGLRWELSPAPSARGNTTLAAWSNVETPGQPSLAPTGTPLWNTTLTNFAPRVGLAYSLTDKGDLVARAGGGIFYDLASDTVGNLANAFPNNAGSFAFDIPLPLSDATQFLPAISLQPPFPDPTQGFDPHLKLPRSYQWNLALEKSFGGQQAVSVTYVGQAGRDLLRQEGISQPNAKFSGVFLLTRNNAYSNYHALQLQYRRPLSTRVQALLNYSWSHSLDNASNDVVNAISSTVVSAQRDYASSDFDVRHSFSAALTCSIPGVHHGPLGYLTKDWLISSTIVARSGFPFNLTVVGAQLGGTNPRPDVVPGQPLWVSTRGAPAGKIVNAAAFTNPADGQQGTAGRNDIPGFGLTQVDLSMERNFSITDKVKLHFRTDAFNILNHPNFANPLGFYLGPSDTTFLQSTQMLNHGLGGLNSLFQAGGPRSLQLSLKLDF
jgi:hypothetical protein